ncbi:MAG: glycosyltransferase [Balneolaceae bacterium]|nr:glycosyltransferase [Balneolaceae bacterium]
MKNLKYVSSYENSGYAVAGKMYVEALDEAGINLTWTPLTYQRKIKGGGGYKPWQGTVQWGETMQNLQFRELEYNSVIIHSIPEFYPEWREREPGKYLVGYTVWETTRPPDHWKDLINTVDHLLVPTEWNKKIFQDHGVTIPIDVIPHISEFEGRELHRPDLLPVDDDQFLFYVVSTWTERKALWKIIEAFNVAFSPDEPVQLLLKTNKIDTTRPRMYILRRFTHKKYYSVRDSVNRLLKKNGTTPNLKLVDDDTLPQEFIQALHTRGDCYVSLCRSEGWGIGAFEAAMYGKPVIMTGFGGQADYLSRENAHLVDYKLIPVEDKTGAKSYNLKQMWAEPDINHAANKMREVYENREASIKMGKELKQHVQTHFSRERIKVMFKEFLGKIP